MTMTRRDLADLEAKHTAWEVWEVTCYDGHRSSTLWCARLRNDNSVVVSGWRPEHLSEAIESATAGLRRRR